MEFDARMTPYNCKLKHSNMKTVKIAVEAIVYTLLLRFKRYTSLLSCAT